MTSKHTETASEKKRIEYFAGYFKAYWQQLFLHAQNKLGDGESARDIVQETFLVLWNSEMLNHPQEVKSYLYGVIRHKILDHFRRDLVKLRYANERANQLEQQLSDPEQNLITKELRAVIEQEIVEMPERMREIFRMKKEQGLSIAEIASHFQLSEQTVKNQLYRATTRIKESIVRYDSAMVIIGMLLYGLLGYLKD
ncbi:RNA polymerase sigma factor [Pedobacter sp.]|uniref:RNA polymerase sigma factor n=1 Tax=Pedobacter sp. TaxID=1411316 RepID=UPI003C5DF459